MPSALTDVELSDTVLVGEYSLDTVLAADHYDIPDVAVIRVAMESYDSALGLDEISGSLETYSSHYVTAGLMDLSVSCSGSDETYL